MPNSKKIQIVNMRFQKEDIFIFELWNLFEIWNLKFDLLNILSHKPSFPPMPVSVKKTIHFKFKK